MANCRFCLSVSFLSFTLLSAFAAVPLHTPATPHLGEPLFVPVKCSNHYLYKVQGGSKVLAGCTPAVESTEEQPDGRVDSGMRYASAGDCGRYVEDNFVSQQDVERLVHMLQKGFKLSSVGPPSGNANGSRRSLAAGPTILDINSGFMRDSKLHNIYKPVTDPESGDVVQDAVSFTSDEYALYKSLFERIRLRVISVFGLNDLFFTAPTFVTRIVGVGNGSKACYEARMRHNSNNASAEPEFEVLACDGAVHGAGRSPTDDPTAIHDQYWHPHVDKANTPHYDYSGLVYLSEYGSWVGSSDEGEDGAAAGGGGDFTGGKFAFLSPHSGSDGAADAGDMPEGAVFQLLETEDSEVVSNNSAGARSPAGRPHWREEHVIEPAAGRLLIFTAGLENVHQVQKVDAGTRYVMSMWFTCDSRREFKTFLDGKVHNKFSGAAAGGAADGTTRSKSSTRTIAAGETAFSTAAFTEDSSSTTANADAEQQQNRQQQQQARKGKPKPKPRASRQKTTIITADDDSAEL